jgi:hypothetical protein
MKKLLLLIVSSIISLGLWAQPPQISAKKLGDIPTSLGQTKSGGPDTLIDQVWDFSGNPVLYSVMGGGFIGGNNINGDRANKQFFYMTAPFSITKLLFWFSEKEGSGAITATIWADSNGMPGTPIRRITLPISAIDTSLYITFTTVDINPPLSFPENSNFWAGIEFFNHSPGDTVGLVMFDGFWAADEYTFIQKANYSDTSIYDYYNIETSFAIFPVVEYPPVFGNIQGTAFLDNNSNGIQDIGESGLPNQLIKAGNYYATTNASGAYNIEVYNAGIYSINHLVQGYLISVNDSLGVNVNSPGIVLSGNNFPCHSIPGVSDLSVSITPSNFRPGFQSYYWLSYSNEGTQIENGSVKLTYDNQLTYISAAPTPDTIIGNTRSWNFTNLTPGENRTILITLETPVSLPIGTTLSTTALIKPIAGDILPANNNDTINHEVSGSYDPNDKSVSPMGDGPVGYIGLNPVALEYTIRFQNTGTDTAFNIVLRDTLDKDMDLSTLRVIASSHPCTYLLSSDRLITVTFPNVLLPDSGTNQAASHGFFKYSIKPKSGLPTGSQLTNYADIYFDFNAAVSTNTVLNTIGIYYGVDENLFDSDKIQIHPNPATTTLSISGLSAPATADIYDISGKLLLTKPLNNQTLNISSLAKGLYFIKLTGKEGSVVRKFVKE